MPTQRAGEEQSNYASDSIVLMPRNTAVARHISMPKILAYLKMKAEQTMHQS